MTGSERRCCLPSLLILFTFVNFKRRMKSYHPPSVCVIVLIFLFSRFAFHLRLNFIPAEADSIKPLLPDEADSIPSLLPPLLLSSLPPLLPQAPRQALLLPL